MTKFKEGDIVLSTGNPEYDYRVVEVLDYHGNPMYSVTAHTHLKTGKAATDGVNHDVPESILYKVSDESI